MSHIIHLEPSTYDYDVKKKVYKYATVEENKAIMKNDLWVVVPKHEGKSVVNSKWFYKIKHVADGNIKKYKARFFSHIFSHK